MIFIYLLEGNAELAPAVHSLYEEMQKRKARLMTSAFAVAEVLTGLKKLRAAESLSLARDFFSSPQIEILPFDLATAEIYASLRSQASMSAPDAIHIATAAHAETDLFITNDRKLQKLSIPGIRFIAGPDGKLW